MASLALPLVRTAPSTRTWTSRLFNFGLTLPVPVVSPARPTLAQRLAALPSLRSLLELFPPIVLAVPKKKTSRSKKRMRSANKGLKDKTNIVNCPGCGTPKRAHHLCPHCFSQINRAWKQQQREVADQSPRLA